MECNRYRCDCTKCFVSPCKLKQHWMSILSKTRDFFLCPCGLLQSFRSCPTKSDNIHEKKKKGKIFRKWPKGWMTPLVFPTLFSWDSKSNRPWAYLTLSSWVPCSSGKPVLFCFHFCQLFRCTLKASTLDATWQCRESEQSIIFSWFIVDSFSSWNLF